MVTKIQLAEFVFGRRLGMRRLHNSRLRLLAAGGTKRKRTSPEGEKRKRTSPEGEKRKRTSPPKSAMKKGKREKRKIKKIQIDQKAIKVNTSHCRRIQWGKKTLPWSEYLRSFFDDNRNNSWVAFGDCIDTPTGSQKGGSSTTRTHHNRCMQDSECKQGSSCTMPAKEQYLHYTNGVYCSRDHPPSVAEGIKYIEQILDPGIEAMKVEQDEIAILTGVNSDLNIAFFQQTVTRFTQQVLNKRLFGNRGGHRWILQCRKDEFAKGEGFSKDQFDYFERLYKKQKTYNKYFNAIDYYRKKFQK